MKKKAHNENNKLVIEIWTEWAQRTIAQLNLAQAEWRKNNNAHIVG